MKLDYDLAVFSIMENHIVIRVKSEADYAKVKNGGPWFVTGQLLAIDT